MKPLLPESVLRWSEPHRLAVRTRVEELLADVAVDPAQRALFQKAGPLLARRAGPGKLAPAVHLPLLTCAAAGGDERDALPLAVCTTILELSMDFLDHVWDEETDQTWGHEDPRVLEMTGILLMVSVAPLALAEVPAPAERITALQRTISARLLRVAAGEMLDLRTIGAAEGGHVSLEEVAAATRGKTGERRALYAVLGAMLADAPPETIAAFEEMAAHYGYARQIASDLADLSAAHSRDLASGCRTWPIAWMLSSATGEMREQLMLALERARTDETAVTGIRAMLRQLGGDLRGILEVEVACQHALAALERAQAREPAAGLLRAMIASSSYTQPCCNLVDDQDRVALRGQGAKMQANGRSPAAQ
jgi:hypothetical protein